MDCLLGPLPDGADREALVSLPLDALVTWRATLRDRNACHLVPVRARVDQRLAQIVAELVDVFARRLVVKSIDHEVKPGEELETEARLLDLAQVGLDFDV